MVVVFGDVGDDHDPSHDRSGAFARGIVYAAGVESFARPRSHWQCHIGKTAGGRNARMLAGGSTVYSKELIHTGDAGVADLRFHDSSNLSVGPKSSVRLDKFVYDPNNLRVALR